MKKVPFTSSPSEVKIERLKPELTDEKKIKQIIFSVAG